MVVVAAVLWVWGLVRSNVLGLFLHPYVCQLFFLAYEHQHNIEGFVRTDWKSLNIDFGCGRDGILYQNIKSAGRVFAALCSLTVRISESAIYESLVPVR